MSVFYFITGRKFSEVAVKKKPSHFSETVFYQLSQFISLFQNQMHVVTHL